MKAIRLYKALKAPEPVVICEHITLPDAHYVRKGDSPEYHHKMTIHCGVCEKDYEMEVWVG